MIRRRRRRAHRREEALVVARDPDSGVLVALTGDDCGTPERRAKGMVAIVSRTVTDGGLLGGRGAVAAEGRLDELIAAGLLGGDPAVLERRRDAGAWLRRVFLRAGVLKTMIGGYGPGSPGGRPEMSDKAASNRRMYARMWEMLPPAQAELLSCVCCYDEMPGPAELGPLAEALDALADWRGM